MLPLKKPQ